MIRLIDWTIIASLATAVGTISLALLTFFLVLYGKKQVTELNKTNKENFLRDIKMDFFSIEARFLMFFIDYNLLEFKSYGINPSSDDELAVFKTKKIENDDVRKALFEAINFESEKINRNKEYFTSYEIDDFLLGHLEDLGLLFEKNLIDIQSIDQMFGYYVVNIFENCAIKNYFDWLKDVDEDIYSNFKIMYHKLKLYQERNQNNHSA